VGVDHCWLTIPILFPIIIFGNMLKNTLGTLGTWWKHFGKDKNKIKIKTV
jgi:hypothetical protein